MTEALRLPAIGRDQSDAIKGIAILLMLAHHLFGLPTLIKEPASYIATVPGVSLDYWIGRFGKICVSIFLLLSGYGFAMRMAQGGVPSWRYFAEKAWRFLLAYWPYFLLALGVGLAFFQERMPNGNLRFPTDPLGIALNALTLKNQMAFEWWFAETYLLLVLLTRPLLQAARRPLLLLAGSTIAFGAGAAMDVARFDPTVISFANLLVWQWPWVVGILAAKYAGQSLRLPFSAKAIAIVLALEVLAGFALVEIIVPQAMTPFLILATPLVVLALVLGWQGLGKGRSGRTLGWLGERTLGLWLVHPFFCYYFFQPQIYAVHYAPLVFAALLLASLLVVIPVEALRGVLFRSKGNAS